MSRTQVENSMLPDRFNAQSSSIGKYRSSNMPNRSIRMHIHDTLCEYILLTRYAGATGIYARGLSIRETKSKI